MKAQNLIFYLVIFVVGLTDFHACAQPQPLIQRQQVLASGERFFPQINRVLTEEQRQSLLGIIETQAQKLRPLEQQARESRRAMVEMISSGKFDEAALRKSAEAASEADVELTIIYAKALSQMKPPLSSQQIEQMKNLQPAQPPRLQHAPQSQVQIVPRPQMDLPTPLPRDSNDLPIVTPEMQK